MAAVTRRVFNRKEEVDTYIQEHKTYFVFNESSEGIPCFSSPIFSELGANQIRDLLNIAYRRLGAIEFYTDRKYTDLETFKYFKVCDDMFDRDSVKTYWKKLIKRLSEEMIKHINLDYLLLSEDFENRDD